ncbi:MAG: hypothetical protein ABI690_11415 [Chloroflexota bacterium]
MKLRLITLLCIGLLLGMAKLMPAAAQDQASVSALNCLGLSDSDCALVKQSAENTSKIQSFAHNFTFSASVSNASQIVQGFDSAVSAQGSGAFAIDNSQTTEATPYAGVSLSINLSSTINDSHGETSGDTTLLIAAGNAYLKDPATGLWRGTSLAGLAQHPEVLSFPFMGIDIPAAQIVQMGVGMTEMGSGQTGTLTADGIDVMALLQVPGFLNQTRLADETIGGQNTAVFAYTADIGVLLSNPDVQKSLANLSDSAGTSDNSMVQQMAFILPVLLQNASGTVTLTRWIGTDDGLPHRVVLDINAPVDLGIKSGNGTPIPPIELKLNFTLDLSAINSTTAPTVPDGATLVPAQQFLPQSG